MKDWEYIEGEEYIVDLASRGCYLKTLEYTKKWFNGPEWLLYEQEKWPTKDLGQHENKDQEADVEEIQRWNCSCIFPWNWIQDQKISESFVNEEGIYRCGGRLRKAGLSFECKHPVILPKYHHITELMIKYNHSNVYHNGVKETLMNKKVNIR